MRLASFKSLFLIVFILSLIIVIPLNAHAGLPTMNCDHLFTGWDDNCLTQKLRTDFYINSNKISDEKLLPYVTSHRDEIIALLLKVDYGRSVNLFLNGNTNSIEDETELLEAVKKAWSNSFGILNDILTVLNTVAESIAIAATTNIINVTSLILGGYDAYMDATVVLTAKETRFLLGVYCQNRYNGMAINEAWQDINDPVYQPIWDLITNLQNISKDILKLKFENAYTTYRLVGYSDSYDIRIKKGNAIVALAGPPTPVISQNPLSGPPGTTFTQSGTNFIGDGRAILHFRKPDGTEYPTQTVHLDSNGSFSISYTTPLNKEPGMYFPQFSGHTERLGYNITI